MSKLLRNILKFIDFIIKNDSLQAILEIEEKKSAKINSPDLTKLEVSCRMNYATSKSKLNDFEVVLI